MRETVRFSKNKYMHTFEPVLGHVRTWGRFLVRFAQLEVSIGSHCENLEENRLENRGSIWEPPNTGYFTRFFVHFPMGFPWNGSVCGVVGHILKRTKISSWKQVGGLRCWIDRTTPFQPSPFCIGEVSKCRPFRNLGCGPTGGTQNS